MSVQREISNEVSNEGLSKTSFSQQLVISRKPLPQRLRPAGLLPDADSSAGGQGRVSIAEPGSHPPDKRAN